MVSKTIEQEHLAQAERHIARAEELLRGQRRLVDRMAEHGHDTEMAQDLLHTMQATLERMYEHRELIEATIAGKGN